MPIIIGELFNLYQENLKAIKVEKGEELEPTKEVRNRQKCDRCGRPSATLVLLGMHLVCPRCEREIPKVMPTEGWEMYNRARR